MQAEILSKYAGTYELIANNKLRDNVWEWVHRKIKEWWDSHLLRKRDWCTVTLDPGNREGKCLIKY